MGAWMTHSVNQLPSFSCKLKIDFTSVEMPHVEKTVSVEWLTQISFGPLLRLLSLSSCLLVVCDFNITTDMHHLFVWSSVMSQSRHVLNNISKGKSIHGFLVEFNTCQTFNFCHQRQTAKFGRLRGLMNPVMSLLFNSLTLILSRWTHEIFCLLSFKSYFMLVIWQEMSHLRA